jgi:hypothetical protein
MSPIVLRLRVLSVGGIGSKKATEEHVIECCNILNRLSAKDSDVRRVNSHAGARTINASCVAYRTVESGSLVLATRREYPKFSHIPPMISILQKRDR